MKTPRPVQMELVGYPCGCCRRVDINYRGWNYCPFHQQKYSGYQVSINPTRTAIEQSKPVEQVLSVRLVRQDGTICDNLF